jgi:hypothetical protein
MPSMLNVAISTNSSVLRYSNNLLPAKRTLLSAERLVSLFYSSLSMFQEMEVRREQ